MLAQLIVSAGLIIGIPVPAMTYAYVADMRSRGIDPFPFINRRT